MAELNGNLPLLSSLVQGSSTRAGSDLARAFHSSSAQAKAVQAGTQAINDISNTNDIRSSAVSTVQHDSRGLPIITSSRDVLPSVASDEVISETNTGGYSLASALASEVPELQKRARLSDLAQKARLTEDIRHGVDSTFADMKDSAPAVPLPPKPQDLHADRGTDRAGSAGNVHNVSLEKHHMQAHGNRNAQGDSMREDAQKPRARPSKKASQAQQSANAANALSGTDEPGKSSQIRRGSQHADVATAKTAADAAATGLKAGQHPSHTQNMAAQTAADAAAIGLEASQHVLQDRTQNMAAQTAADAATVGLETVQHMHASPTQNRLAKIIEDAAAIGHEKVQHQNHTQNMAAAQAAAEAAATGLEAVQHQSPEQNRLAKIIADAAAIEQENVQRQDHEKGLSSAKSQQLRRELESPHSPTDDKSQHRESGQAVLSDEDETNTAHALSHGLQGGHIPRDRGDATGDPLGASGSVAPPPPGFESSLQTLAALHGSLGHRTVADQHSSNDQSADKEDMQPMGEEAPLSDPPPDSQDLESIKSADEVEMQKRQQHAAHARAQHRELPASGKSTGNQDPAAFVSSDGNPLNLDLSRNSDNGVIDARHGEHVTILEEMPPKLRDLKQDGPGSTDNVGSHPRLDGNGMRSQLQAASLADLDAPRLQVGLA